MEPTSLKLPSAARFLSKGHSRTISRSPTRPHLMDGILSDLSPQTTLEAFTSASGTLKASIETASPTQRAFGIRAAIASKKIHQWVDELMSWPWPASACERFEIPAAKHRKLCTWNPTEDDSRSMEERIRDGRSVLDYNEYWGCLPAQEVIRYEARVDEILDDMDDLDVEEIKRQVLDTHILPKTRPSSSLDEQPVTLSVTSYTAMDDFTAIVTATVIQALPVLSQLMELMNIWSVRLAILRQVPLFTRAMDDAEIALRRGWEKLRIYSSNRGENGRVVSRSETPTLLRSDFEAMRDSLQNKVGILGRQIDQMLDSLEGRQDTLPEAWLDRMEAIEKDYGEWTVRGERNIREGEWAKDAAQLLEKKKLLASTVVEDQSHTTQNSTPITDDHQRPIQNHLLITQSPVQPLGNSPPDTESSARPAETLSPTEKATQVGKDFYPPTLITRQIQSSELIQPVQSQPSDINGHTIAAKSQQESSLSQQSRTSSSSEAEIKTRRSKPFQAGLNWYLTHGQSSVNPPTISMNPIVKEPAKPSKLSISDSNADKDQPTEAQNSHGCLEVGLLDLRSTSKISEVDINGIHSTTTELPLQIPISTPLLADEMLYKFISQEVLADLSSFTDGIFEEDGKTNVIALNENTSPVASNISTNPRGSSSSFGPSKTDAIKSYPKVMESHSHNNDVVTPPLPAKIPRFGSGVANSLRQTVPLTILPADNDTSSHSLLDVERAEIARIKEADALGRSLSYTNRSNTTPHNDGQITPTFHIPPTTVEHIAVNNEIDGVLQPVNLLTLDSPLDVTSVGPYLKEFQPYKLSKAIFAEKIQSKLLSDNDSKFGSLSNNIQHGKYSIATTNRVVDFSDTNSSDKGSIVTTTITNSRLSEPLAPSKQVTDISCSVSSRPLSAGSAKILTSSTSIVPVRTISIDQNHFVSKIKFPETQNPVKPTSLPPASTGSISAGAAATVSAYLIAGSLEPTERIGRYDPPTNVSHGNEPTTDDLLNESAERRGDRGPQGVLSETAVSVSDNFEPSSNPLVATEPHNQLHWPLDNDNFESSAPVSVTMSSADSSDPAIEVASKISTPIVFLPYEIMPLVDELPEPIEARSTPTTPILVVSNHSILESETFEAERLECSRPIPSVEISHADSSGTASAITSTIPSFEVLVPSNNINSGVVEEIEEAPAASSESKLSDAQTAPNPLKMTENSSLEHKVSNEKSDYATSEELSHSRKSSTASVLVHRSDEIAGTPSENNFFSISPTIVALNSGAVTPIMVLSPEASNESPNADKMSTTSFLAYDEDSPSIRRMRQLDDYSPLRSSLSELYVSKYRLPQLDTSQSFASESTIIDSPEPVAEAPVLANIEISPAPPPLNAVKTSDDQLQQQISEILESIPARIKLTSEPETTKMSRIPKLKKQTSRSSLNPQSYPLSRASTPSFTLAPAYAKNPRPRPQNGNPEIKLYHLSRSTGDTPIKLFVRLVGEKGERVMVRVGGGWADLGEYLKEYASHHKRRSDQEGKVEIQDLPPRLVSTSSSTSTIRNGAMNRSGRYSPVSRPASSLDRPISSLAVRKTRKSVGEDARERGYRSPSTPLTSSFRGSPSLPRTLDTPPSASSRSVSRMSWTEDESALGLAGPKSRKVEISAENAAWVESMKEKVRVASAEKEKEKEKKPDFGEMERVGTTKRLFKKGG